LEGGFGGFAEAFEVLEDVMGKAVDHGRPDILVVVMLSIRIVFSTRRKSPLTEYEFSPSADDPVEMTFGE
jgi:hypothetical protein